MVKEPQQLDLALDSLKIRSKLMCFFLWGDFGGS